MTRHTAVLGIVLLLLGCDRADQGDRPDAEPPEGPLTEARRQALCADVQNQYECSTLVEGELLRRGAPASRHGDTLELALAGGATRIFADHGSEAEAVRYTYDGRLAGIGYHAVQVHYYEGGAHLLVDDASGEVTRVPGPPVVSPDGRRIAIATFGGVAGYAPDLLQLRRVTRGLPVEWELHPDDWGAESPRWIDSVTVRFTRLWSCDTGTCEGEGELHRADGEWSVTEVGAGAGSS